MRELSIRLILAVLTLSSFSTFADLCREKGYIDQLKTEISSLTEGRGKRFSKTAKLKLSETVTLEDTQANIKFLASVISKKKLKAEFDNHPEWAQCKTVECIMLTVVKTPEIYYRALRDHLRYGSAYLNLTDLTLDQVRTMSVAQAMVGQYSKNKLSGMGFKVKSLSDDDAIGLWDGQKISLDPSEMKSGFSGISTVIHEMGHALDTESMNSRQAELRFVNDKNPITAYASTDSSNENIESFAEHYSYGYFFSKVLTSTDNIKKNKLIHSWYTADPQTWVDSWFDKNPSESAKLKDILFSKPESKIRYYFDSSSSGQNAYRVEYNMTGLKDNTTVENYSLMLSVFTGIAKKAIDPYSSSVLTKVQSNPFDLKQYCDFVSNESFLKELFMINLLNQSIVPAGQNCAVCH